MHTSTAHRLSKSIVAVTLGLAVLAAPGLAQAATSVTSILETKDGFGKAVYKTTSTMIVKSVQQDGGVFISGRMTNSIDMTFSKTHRFGSRLQARVKYTNTLVSCATGSARSNGHKFVTVDASSGVSTNQSKEFKLSFKAPAGTGCSSGGYKSVYRPTSLETRIVLVSCDINRVPVLDFSYTTCKATPTASTWKSVVLPPAS